MISKSRKLELRGYLQRFEDGKRLKCLWIIEEMLGRKGLQVIIKGVLLDVFFPLCCNPSERDIDVALAICCKMNVSL